MVEPHNKKQPAIHHKLPAAPRQLSPVLPRERHAVPVAEWVPDPVIGDGLPVVARQQVLPRPIGIAVGYRPLHRPQRPRGIRVLLDPLDVSALVIGIGEALVLCRAVMPRQLVQAGVCIAFLQLTVLPDAGDVPVVVTLWIRNFL